MTQKCLKEKMGVWKRQYKYYQESLKDVFSLKRKKNKQNFSRKSHFFIKIKWSVKY